jgi:tetratricopeptide (TPR) repeat protein
MERLTAMLVEQGEDPFLLFALAKEYESAADDLQALVYYQRCETADPAYVGVYYHLGKCLQRLGQTDAAISALVKGRQVAKQLQDRHSWNELYAAHLELDDPEDQWD